MPTVYNKVVIDGVTKIDLSQDTVTEAGHILTGHTGHLANGNQVSGTGSGGSNAYTRTQILPVQTFTPDSSNKRATLTGLSEGFVDAGYYIVTYDNAEWIVTCETLWTNNYAIGEAQYFLNTSAFESANPFGIVWVSGTTCTIAVGDTNQHTVKIEKLTFDDNPTLLAQKSITANGTYNASSDNADGYSSVAVNVPIGIDIPIFTLTWDSNFETILSVTCNKTYAQCESICQSSETPTAAAIALTDFGDTLFYASLSFTDIMGASDARGDALSYTYLEHGTPLYDINFFEDGTIAAVQPSNRARTLNATSNGTYTPEYGDYVWNEVIVNVSSSSPSLQAKTNISPTTSSQTITADSGYDGLSSVQINAMPSGTAGTPSATKGAVSNHSISVTPSVTNTTGYITGGTKTGTAVTVSASELVSGSETKTANNTYDVTNLAELVVNVPTGTARSSSDLTVSGATVTVPAGLYSSQATKSVASGSAGTPTASKGTVSNHSITVTPSVTNTTGYITGGTKTGTGVTVSASELVSGSQTISANGTVDVTNLASVNVALTFSTITTSSSSPTGGSNGDIWIKTS